MYRIKNTHTNTYPFRPTGDSKNGRRKRNKTVLFQQPVYAFEHTVELQHMKCAFDLERTKKKGFINLYHCVSIRRTRHGGLFERCIPLSCGAVTADCSCEPSPLSTNCPDSGTFAARSHPSVRCSGAGGRVAASAAYPAADCAGSSRATGSSHSSAATGGASSRSVCTYLAVCVN